MQASAVSTLLVTLLDRFGQIRERNRRQTQQQQEREIALAVKDWADVSVVDGSTNERNMVAAATVVNIRSLSLYGLHTFRE